MNYARMMHQIATYWAPTGATDLFGKQVFAPSVLLKCRWEDKSELYLNKASKEVISKSKIYFAQDIDIDGYLYLGQNYDVVDPRELIGAHEIQMVQRTPDLRNLSTLYVAWL